MGETSITCAGDEESSNKKSDSPAFIFAVYRDELLVKRLIGQLCHLYPDAELVCVADGRPEAWFPEYCDRLGVRLVIGERLKLAEHGGHWAQRLFQMALEHSTSPHIIRTEGDCYHWRSFNNYPRSDVAGTLSRRYDVTFARGGCCYFKRDALVRLLDSRELLQSRYRHNPIYRYTRYNKWRYDDEVRDDTPIALADLIIGDACKRAGLSLSAWGEVDIQVKDGMKPGEGFAATHPHR